MCINREYCFKWVCMVSVNFCVELFLNRVFLLIGSDDLMMDEDLEF